MSDGPIDPVGVMPQIIGLKFAIQELLSELAVDTIQEQPRTVLLALRGLLTQVEDITADITKTPAARDAAKPTDEKTVIVPESVARQYLNPDAIIIRRADKTVTIMCNSSEDADAFFDWLPLRDQLYPVQT